MIMVGSIGLGMGIVGICSKLIQERHRVIAPRSIRLVTTDLFLSKWLTTPNPIAGSSEQIEFSSI